MTHLRFALAGLFLSSVAAAPLCARQDSVGVIASSVRISEGEGGFVGPLGNGDAFGAALGALSDFNADGLVDVAVGAPANGVGGTGSGVVWILSLLPDGSVGGEIQIGGVSGGLGLSDGDAFGHSIAGLGDLDGVGQLDLAVGAPGDDTGGAQRGSVRIVSLDGTGAVISIVLLSDRLAGLSLSNGDAFGASLTALGDLDGNGVIDIAVGAPGDDDTAGFGNGTNLGAVYVLLLKPTGKVKSVQKISATQGGFAGALEDNDAFGSALANLGDLDGDGRLELAVGAPGDDDGGPMQGAVWILSLNANGTSQGEAKISATSGGFNGLLDDADSFGASVSAPGDLDGDGSGDLLVGAPGDDDGGTDIGALWALFLQSDGSVSSSLKVSAEAGGFEGSLANGDRFGASVTTVGDPNGDGVVDLAVGLPGASSEAGNSVGALFSLLLTGPGTTIRNGSGCNPIALFDGTTPPSLGALWDPFVEFDVPLGALGGDLLFNFVGVSLGFAGPNQFGSQGEPCNELLISLAPQDLVLLQAVSVGGSFQIAIPTDPSTVGLVCYSQGGDIDSLGGIRLTNALDAVIGF